MTIHTPTTPFNKIRPHWDGEEQPTSALNVVKNLTEDQCRYALWAALVICFGSEECNATEMVEIMSHVEAAFPRMVEAQLILHQVALQENPSHLAEKTKEVLIRE